MRETFISNLDPVNGIDAISRDQRMETKPDLVKDVVCGMMVDPKTAPARSEYRGTTYFFCAKGCKVAFDKDPGKYLAGQAAPPPK